MEISQEKFWDMSKEEIVGQLKAVYQNQKLDKTGNMIARGMEIFVGLIGMFLCEEWIYKITAFLIAAYGAYRLIKPHGEDENYYKEFESLADIIQQYKKEILIGKNIEEYPKNAKRIYKIVLQFLNEDNKSFKICKIFAFIPLLNVRLDEMFPYSQQFRGNKRAIERYLKSDLKVRDKK